MATKQYRKNRVKHSWSLAQRIAHHSIPNEATGCIEWSGTLNDAGYGLLMWEKKYRRAHRLAWEMKNGVITGGLFLCHRCDNPKCINVDHLFLGTPTDNMRDKIAKGRGNATKLTVPEAQEIKAAKGLQPRRTVAERYGVSERTISAIWSGENWTHI